MERSSSMPERAHKRRKPSQSLKNWRTSEPAQDVPRPTSRSSREGWEPHLITVRGASPVQIDRPMTFSHATLPNFENFGQLSEAPATSRAPLVSMIAPCQAVRAIGESQIENFPYHALNGSTSVIPEADLSSGFTYPFSNAFEMDNYICDKDVIASIENSCCASQCTAKSCPSCVSCEESCDLPCEHPQECSSAICRNQSCVCSPRPTCTGQYTPAYEQCEWVGNGENCTAEVHSPGQTVQHVTESHIKPQTQITCEWDSCGISTDVHRLPNHLWSDHGPISYVCLWYDCEEAFSTHEELDVHFKLVHCHMGCHWAGCEMITTSQTELQNHFSQQHLQFSPEIEHDKSVSEQSFSKLVYDSASSGSNTSLGLQISPIDSTSANFSTATSENDATDSQKCEVAGTKACMWTTNKENGAPCGIVFDNGNKLQEHIRNSHILGLKPSELKCGWVGCEYSQPTKDKSKLARHAFTHSKYCVGVCRVCKQGFSEKSKLQQHETIHLSEKPYACKECDRRFPSQNALTNHERIHNGEKPLICGMVVKGQKCDYTCSDPSNMSTHKKKHLPPKFACTICEKTFCRNDALKRHMLVHDPKRMVAKKRAYAGPKDFTNNCSQGM